MLVLLRRKVMLMVSLLLLCNLCELPYVVCPLPLVFCYVLRHTINFEYDMICSFVHFLQF